MGTLPASIHKYTQVHHGTSIRQSHHFWTAQPYHATQTVFNHTGPSAGLLSRQLSATICIQLAFVFQDEKHFNIFQSFEMQLWGQNLQGTELLLQWHAMTTCMTRLALWTCSQSSTRHLTCQINLLIPVATAIIRYHTSQTKAYHTPLKANACVSNAGIPDSGSSWG
jgi:hypothetical protein